VKRESEATAKQLNGAKQPKLQLPDVSKCFIEDKVSARLLSYLTYSFTYALISLSYSFKDTSHIVQMEDDQEKMNCNKRVAITLVNYLYYKLIH